MIPAQRGRSPMLAFRTAGFIATSTLGASPGVRMSWSAKRNWTEETPGRVPAGGTDRGGEVRRRRQVLPEGRRLRGEAVTGELDAIARIIRESDDDVVQSQDLLGVRH
ncbi:hypothetical protein ADL35_32915 [Streptomyces sp. NRRL WC-3753]|nr:hypothetical protein ADL35_32915 [Streptomyces sp. NRRL WC-3753]